jgi:imidazoleglycerol-phosphate dehydratase
MRKALIIRKTRETDITMSLNIDGKGIFKGTSGIGFFDHMLNSLCVHSGIDMELQCKGDLQVDCHHTIEDIGIVLGKAFSEAMSNKKGIARYGTFYIPMDEALAMASIDVSGRAYLVFNAEFNSERVGEFDTCMVREFFRAFAMNSDTTLHINLNYGDNAHHCIEAIFKAFAHAIRVAVSSTGSNEELSAKGVL